MDTPIIIMKRKFITLLTAVAAVFFLLGLCWQAHGEEYPPVKCPACSLAHVKSMVWPESTVCTHNGFYDTLGNYQAPYKIRDCLDYFRCSNGHNFVVKESKQ